MRGLIPCCGQDGYRSQVPQQDAYHTYLGYKKLFKNIDIMFKVNKVQILKSFGNLVVESSVFVFIPAYRYLRPNVHVRAHYTFIDLRNILIGRGDQLK